MVVALIFSTYAAILLYQISCIAAGILLGLRPYNFSIGPVEIQTSSGRLRVSRQRKARKVGSLGFDTTRCSPAEAVVALRRTLMAGSLVLAIVSIGIFAHILFSPSQSSEVDPDLVEPAIFAAFAAIALMSVSPIEGSPGKPLSRLRKGDIRAENMMRALQLVLVIHRPWRPREWPKEVPDIACSLLNEPPTNVYPDTKCGAALFLYEYLADWGQLEKALEWLEWFPITDSQTAKPNPRDPMDGIIAARARHYALWNNDPARAAHSLSRLSERSWIRGYTEWLMPTALIQLSHGDHAAARKTVEEARNNLKPLIGRVGYAQMEMEWLDIIEQRLNEASSSAAPQPASSVA
jgi:hypothetical protein